MGSIFKPAFVLMSGRAFGFAATFAIPMVLARIFDRGEFGTYKQLFLIYSTLYSVAQLGMAESLFYFIPAAPRLAGRYALNTMLALGVAGGVCLALLWGGRFAVAGWLNNAALAGYLPLIGVYLMFMLASAGLEIAMTAHKHHLHACIAYGGADLSRAAMLLLPVWYFGGLWWLLAGAIAFASLRFGTTLLYMRRRYGGGFAPDAALARTQLAYAAPFSIYVLIEVVQTNLHMYAVSYRFDPAIYATYAVGCLSIPLVDFLTSSVGNVMMVRMREHLLAGEREAVLAIWRDTTRRLLVVFAALVGGLLVVAHELIVALFTQRYAASVPVFMVWNGAMLFSALLTDAVLRVYGQMRFLMMLGVVKLALVAATIGWFMAAFGIVGAVLAVLLTIAASKICALVRIRTVMRCRVGEFLPWRAVATIPVAAAIAAGAAFAVKPALATANVPLLAVSGFVYISIYASLLWCGGALTDEEKRAAAGWVRRPLATWRAA